MKQEQGMQLIRQIAKNESINFWMTNHIPRVLLTHLVGKISKIKSPIWTRIAIATWKLFTPLDLSEATKS